MGNYNFNEEMRYFRSLYDKNSGEYFQEIPDKELGKLADRVSKAMTFWEENICPSGDMKYVDEDIEFLDCIFFSSTFYYELWALEEREIFPEKTMTYYTNSPEAIIDDDTEFLEQVKEMCLKCLPGSGYVLYLVENELERRNGIIISDEATEIMKTVEGSFFPFACYMNCSCERLEEVKDLLCNCYETLSTFEDEFDFVDNFNFFVLLMLIEKKTLELGVVVKRIDMEIDISTCTDLIDKFEGNNLDSLNEEEKILLRVCSDCIVRTIKSVEEFPVYILDEYTENVVGSVDFLENLSLEEKTCIYLYYASIRDKLDDFFKKAGFDLVTIYSKRAKKAMRAFMRLKIQKAIAEVSDRRLDGLKKIVEVNLPYFDFLLKWINSEERRRELLPEKLYRLSQLALKELSDKYLNADDYDALKVIGQYLQ